MTLDIMPYGKGNFAVIQWVDHEPTGKRPFRVVSIEDTRNKARKKIAAIIAKANMQGKSE